MSRVRTQGAELAVGARSRSGDLGRRRVELKVWRRTERGLQESVVFSAGRSRERTAHLSTWHRQKQDSWLTNSSLYCFIVPLTC